MTALGLQRDIVATVDGFSAALALARASDLIATVPERHTGSLRAGMRELALPFPVPGSRFHCFGTRDSRPTPGIAGCAAW